MTGADRNQGENYDDIGQAFSGAANTTKQIGQAVMKKSAAKAAASTANAAAATVNASVQGGKAFAGIAAGTAMGGPWGALISAAWSMRHTLFKVLIFIWLSDTFIITLLISLPSVIGDSLFGTNGVKPQDGVTIESVYSDVAAEISDAVDIGYNLSIEKVKHIISDGDYDYDMSMDALINNAKNSAGYDVCYIVAAYSASMLQQNTSKDDMKEKLVVMATKMFPVTSEPKEKEITVPKDYMTYKAVKVTVVKARILTGYINGVPQYRYVTEEQTFYTEDKKKTTDKEIKVDKYVSEEVVVPTYVNGRVDGTETKTYYRPDGQEDINPETKNVKYVECTIHEFDSSVINEAFGISPDAKYENFDTTYGEVITCMASSLKRTLYGSIGSELSIPVTETEMIEFVEKQDCNATRKKVITTALSIVGRVPYFWGGKSEAGWNDEWNTPKLVTAAGSATTGTIRPYGLDCSGFTSWVYSTVFGIDIGAGTYGQYPNTSEITADEIQPGDLGFLASSDGSSWDHVLIFAGYNDDGKRMWVHSTSGEGVVFNSPDYDGSIVLRRLNNVDYDKEL